MATANEARAVLGMAAIAADEHGDAAMASSAAVCLDDGEQLFAKGEYEYAINRAVSSLKYSVGILHPEYAAAKKIQARSVQS